MTLALCVLIVNIHLTDKSINGVFGVFSLKMGHAHGGNNCNDFSNKQLTKFRLLFVDSGFLSRPLNLYATSRFVPVLHRMDTVTDTTDQRTKERVRLSVRWRSTLTTHFFLILQGWICFARASQHPQQPNCLPQS